MNAELEALARRAVACKGWRWMAGMRVVRPDGTFPLRIVQSGCLAHEGAPEDGWPPRVQVAKGLHLHDIPDLSDPATLGAFTEVVRLAWGAHHVSVTLIGAVNGYEVDVQTLPGALAEWQIGCLHLATGRTVPAALVAALEAAS